MNAEDKQFLEDNRHHYDTLMQAGFINLDHTVKERMLRIVRENWAPAYLFNSWCGSCVVDFAKYVYTQFDNYLATTKHETFPKHDREPELDAPVDLHATEHHVIYVPEKDIIEKAEPKRRGRKPRK